MSVYVLERARREEDEAQTIAISKLTSERKILACGACGSQRQHIWDLTKEITVTMED
jgi:hypothetical protein